MNVLFGCGCCCGCCCCCLLSFIDTKQDIALLDMWSGISFGRRDQGGGARGGKGWGEGGCFLLSLVDQTSMEGVGCLNFQKYLYIIYLLPVYMEGVPCLHFQKYLYIIYLLPVCYLCGGCRLSVFSEISVCYLHVPVCYLYIWRVFVVCIFRNICMLSTCYLYIWRVYLVCIFRNICILSICYLYVTCIYGGCLLSAFSEISVCYLFVTCMLPVYMEGVPCLRFQKYLYVICLLPVCYLYIWRV